MLALESCEVYPASALVKKQPEVKAAAREKMVRITEHGRAAYVFASEEVFRREVAEAVAEYGIVRFLDCISAAASDRRYQYYLVAVLYGCVVAL